MKPMPLFIALLWACTTLLAQNTQVPDNNFEQALIDLGLDTGPIDGTVPTANINTVTVLDVSNKNIIELDGIEDFVALEELYVYGNQLTTLDLSQNTSLKILWCHNNYTIQTLNITGNNQLEVLNCRVNDISYIDTSNKPNLKEFNVAYNLLTDVDVSQNPALQIVDVKYNTLSELNVKNTANSNITHFSAENNLSLSCIVVDDATWATTEWSGFIDGTATFVEGEEYMPQDSELMDVTGECSVNSLAAPTAVNPCSGDMITGTTATTFPITDLGTNEITWSFDDGNGSIITATQNIIVEDTTAPDLVGQDIEVDLNGNTSINIAPNDVTASATDNCSGLQPLALDIDSFTSIGEHHVLLTATDNSGNQAQQTVTVTVIDSVEPTGNWIGNTDNNWNNIVNWSGGQLPLSTDDIVVPNTATNMPVLSGNTTVNNLTVETGATLTVASDASLIVEGASTGNITVQRNLTANWHMISSPVSSYNLEDYINNHILAAGSGSFIGLAPYNNEDDTWAYANVSTTGAWLLGTGYSTLLASAGTVSFTGEMPSGTINAPLVQGASSNFNLVGNPYPGYISVNDVFAENGTSTGTGVITEETLWFWDGTQYVTVNNLNGDFIAPVQGFFVKASGLGDFTFTETMQSHNSGTFYKTNTDGLIKLSLNLSNGTFEGTTDIYLTENATTGFDNGYDSSMFTGSLPELGIYTNLVDDSDEIPAFAGMKLAIQALPNSGFNEIVVPVGIISSEAQSVTFSFSEINNLPDSISVYLEDTLMNTSTPLDNGNTYQIDLNEGDATDGRFFLNLNNATFSADTETANAPQLALTEGHTLTVSNLKEMSTLNVYNLLGQNVFNTTLTPSAKQQVNLPLSTGVYVAKINGNAIKKIIVSQ